MGCWRILHRKMDGHPESLLHSLRGHTHKHRYVNWLHYLQTSSVEVANVKNVLSNFSMLNFPTCCLCVGTWSWSWYTGTKYLWKKCLYEMWADHFLCNVSFSRHSGYSISHSLTLRGLYKNVLSHGFITVLVSTENISVFQYFTRINRHFNHSITFKPTS